MRSSAPPPPPPSGSFSATFQPTGTTNNWWVEVRVTSDRPITAVHAVVDGGSPIPLSRTDWGTWARSFHVADGSRVVFAAKDGNNNQATSQQYVWGDASKPPPSAFSATFQLGQNVNNWWVDVRVDANEPVSRVTATVNGGSPVALDKTSWGTWAKSFHVPTGSSVVFTATSSTGATKQSQTFTWMGSSGGSGGTTGPFTAKFTVKDTTNNWWVEVWVDGSKPVSAVHVQVDGGTWQELPKTSWGSYAKSFHVKDGAKVVFRATSGSEVATSQTYAWT